MYVAQFSLVPSRAYRNRKRTSLPLPWSACGEPHGQRTCLVESLLYRLLLWVGLVSGIPSVRTVYMHPVIVRSLLSPSVFLHGMDQWMGWMGWIGMGFLLFLFPHHCIMIVLCVIWYRIMLCCVGSCHIVLCHIVPYCIVLCPIIFVSCCVMLCHIGTKSLSLPICLSFSLDLNFLL